MEYEFAGGRLEFNRTLSDLDSLVLDFAQMLDEAGIKYVIISGYVAILFGRSRTTEDIDLFIEKMNFDRFGRLFDKILENGYWILNADTKEHAFSMLDESLSIRVAKNNDAIPNFEVKFPKKEIDLLSLDEPLKAVVNGRSLNISQLEIQVPFKLWLGSDKDIEDATHIYELFKERLNKELMRNIAKELGVEKKMIEYGLE